ncbi:MAG: hypothetical protein J6K58_06860 [Lachnospiraceae bacterium]|nr:hypothetical protein [Lachnospiraceae bacterium]MBP3458912.1 hypothetical protein [Lachnospiraceae bacterium]
MKRWRVGKVLLLTMVSLLLLSVAEKNAAAKTETKAVTIQEGKIKTVKSLWPGSVKKYRAKCSDKRIASVRMKRIGIQIKGKKAGKAKITVKVINRKKQVNTYKFKVTVKVNKKNSSNAASTSTPKPTTEVTMKPAMPVFPTGTPSPRPTSVVTPTPEPTATLEAKPKYSYEVEVLNDEMTQYGNISWMYPTGTVIYIKTENPDLSTIDIWGGTEKYEYHEEGYYTVTDGFTVYSTNYVDINYLDEDREKVAGGYVFMCTWNTPGIKNLTIAEKVGEEWVIGVTKNILLKDYDKEVNAWYENVLNEVTNAEMTDYEKMDALKSYVLNHFMYLCYYEDTDGNWLGANSAVNEGVFWENRHIDCIGATIIMCHFAEKLGLEAEWTYAGYLNHHYATVYIDGDGYEFDACPMPNTGRIKEWEYII